MACTNIENPRPSHRAENPTKPKNGPTKNTTATSEFPPRQEIEEIWKKGKDPHPQDKIQHLDFTKDPRPLYYKTPSCVVYHENVCSKAVFGP